MGFSPATRRSAWAIAPALVAILSGCASSRSSRKAIAGAEYRIRHVRFDGNRALSHDQILAHTNLGETRWFPLPQKRYFFEALVPSDRRRIEALYAAHGYYDARVIAIRPVFHRKRKIVDLAIAIEEGPPVVVDSVEIEWPEGAAAGPDDRKARPEYVEGRSQVAVSDVFSRGELHASAATMRTALMERGYAFAEVEAHAEVDRSRRLAAVRFVVRPGRFVRIGEIRVEGARQVPERLIRVEIEGDRGRRFSPSRIEHMERAVYGLEAFDSVTVDPDDQAQGDALPVTVRVLESKPQTIKLGVGFGVDPNRWEQYGALRYGHVNLFGNLTRLDVPLRVGYAELPAIYDPREHGPVVLLEPALRKKGWLEKQLVWTFSPAFELGIQQGYQFYGTRTRVGVSRFFTRYVETALSHNFRFVDFFSVAPTLEASDSILGLDFRDPYRLSFVELELRLHLTDRLLDPQQGVVLGVTYDLAGGFVGGQYDYHKITPELRAYFTPIRRRLQFAARFSSGFIVPFGDEPGAPFDLNYYLGGANSVRGWGLRRLAPQIRSCDEDGGDCTTIPIGGRSMVTGSVEIRTRVWRDLWLVGFADMGDVRAPTWTVVPDGWNYSAGPGVRYYSRIGVFRLDAGIRINRPARFAAEPVWALHFGLGEAF